MLRFILRRVTRDQGHLTKTSKTMDVDIPGLEDALLAGGWGHGPDGDDFDYVEVVDVEVLGAVHPNRPKKSRT